VTEQKSPRIGVVGVPDGWSSLRLADAVAARTGYRLLIDMSKVVADLARGKVMYGDVDLCTLDGLLIKKVGQSYSQGMLDRLEILRFVEASGVPVFSKPESILRLLDRLSCTVTLVAGGIPMPPTVVTESPLEAAEAVKRFERAVLKPLFSTKARGMVVLDGHDPELGEQIGEFQSAGNPIIYLQKFLKPQERDYGAMFLGGKHIGSYARVRGGDAWNTTIHSGGKYQPADLDEKWIDLAYRAQALFNLELTGVDLVETEDGPMVFEVSAFGGFRGLLDARNVDVAELYADYAVKKVRGE
jgi:tetrahydromethanopterin:alpha-L-glutamate ligase